MNFCQVLNKIAIKSKYGSLHFQVLLGCKLSPVVWSIFIGLTLNKVWTLQAGDSVIWSDSLKLCRNAQLNTGFFTWSAVNMKFHGGLIAKHSQCGLYAIKYVIQTNSLWNRMKVYSHFLTLPDDIMASLLQCLFHPLGFFRHDLPLCSSSSSAVEQNINGCIF